VSKGKKSETVYYRAVKFEIFPTVEQLAVLREVSEILRTVWNTALEKRQVMFETHLTPLYNLLKKTGERSGSNEEIVVIQERIKFAFKENNISLFDQINALTGSRKSDERLASIPRNWQEETLDTLNGSFSSFMSLRKRGDKDSRPPRLRKENRFFEISGRRGFKLSSGREYISFSCGKISNDLNLEFPIPKFVQDKLSKAVGVKKFTLYPDGWSLDNPGRFWVSLAYEMNKPETVKFLPEDAVYIALGASSIGVTSLRGDEEIRFWRSDKHWQPKVESISERMKNHTKGSRSWKKLANARRKIQGLNARQQKHDQRNVVTRKLLKLGRHFVVTELVIRSKSGKLADSSKPERGGMLGANWSAQNTGNIANTIRQLEEKVKEVGGSVRKFKLNPPPGLTKIEYARLLREGFLAALKESGVKSA